MPDAEDELFAAYESGCSDGGASLGRRERELYLIGDFVIEYLQGGWPDNWLGESNRFANLITAMRARGLFELAVLVEEILKILSGGDDLLRELTETGETIATWEFYERFDPEGRVAALRKLIGQLDNFGLPKNW